MKIVLFPFLLCDRFKSKFSYKFLKKFLSDNKFKSKVIGRVVVVDFVFNFIPLFFLLKKYIFHSTDVLDFLVLVLIYILGGTGILLSYLSLFIWAKFKRIP